jgi:uncharacterized damage-inducible protein DinB
MSKLQLITNLYDYHRWANERLLDAMAMVDERELMRGFPIPFGNVKDNMLHILGSQVSWVMRLTGETPELSKVEDGNVVPALRESFLWAHDYFASYVASLSDEEIEGVTAVIEFGDDQPRRLERPLWEILLSVGSHGIAHRAEVTVALAQMGADPDQMDYSEFAWRGDLRESAS